MDRKLGNDTTLKENYDQRLSTHLSKSYIKPVKRSEPEPNSIWYMPHHSIQNANKRENFEVWQMPLRSIKDNHFNRTDLLKSFLVVLLRFCEQPVAILADIENMIMQISVKKRSNSTSISVVKNDFIVQYQFNRLIFGAT